MIKQISFRPLTSPSDGFERRYLMSYPRPKEESTIKKWCRETLGGDNFLFLSLTIRSEDGMRLAFLDLKTHSDAALFVLYWADHIETDYREE